MPVGAFVPSRIHLDYPEWQAPLIGNVGQVWAYDGTGYVPTSFLLSSAVSVYGLTLASAADAAAARTALALGTAAVLNVGTGANQIVQLDGSARLPAVDGSQLTGISGGSVAGSNTQVIINDGGVYAGDPGLTYAKATDRLTVVGGIVAGDWSPPSDSTTAVSIWNAARSARVVTVDTTNRRLSVTSLSNHVRLIYTSDTAKYCSFGANSAGTLSISTTSGQVEYYDGTNSYFFRVFAANNENVRVHSNGTSWLAGGNIGIGQSSGITALLDLAASTTARASLRVRAGTAPTSPNAGDIWDDGSLVAYNIDATTNAVVNSLKLRRGSSGTPAAGFGLGIAARLESSTTEDQDAGRLTYEWVTATHASRASRGKLTAYYTSTEQTAMTWDGDPGGLKLAFYGVTPIARQLLATGAGATVDDVITALQNLGLVKQS